MVGMAALAELRQGSLEVTPERVSLRGTGPDPATSAKVEALLAAKIDGTTAVDIGYDAESAAKAAIVTGAAEPVQSCAEDIAAILQAGSIQFAAGSAEIEPASEGVILAIADVLRGCPRAHFEIGGYTDSRGGAEANLRLSQDRADAVAAALRKAALPEITLTARGYGAEQPVADNGTEAGRALNRRIAFRPLGAAGIPEPAAAPGPTDQAEARHGPQ